jgi:hypothetical protein
MSTLRFDKVWQGTSKTDIKIRHHGKYCYPIYFPIWLPQQCSRGTKNGRGDKKGLGQICINSFDERMLSYNRWLWFFCFGALTGPYLTLRFGGACGLGVGAF